MLAFNSDPDQTTIPAQQRTGILFFDEGENA
jgi:hypothetical protein